LNREAAVYWIARSKPGDDSFDCGGGLSKRQFHPDELAHFQTTPRGPQKSLTASA
jgi:hypothetical protein